MVQVTFVVILFLFSPLCVSRSLYAQTPSEPALGIPVQIGWQVPLNRSVAFVLEVAKDSGFSKMVMTTQVRGTGHLWVAPGEGVYHWRLAKADKKGAGGEVVSTVSGSFVALDPKTQRKTPAKISWGVISGADQYQIFMFDQDGRTRISTTKSTLLLVPEGLGITMVEVIPQKGAMSLQKSYHFLPTLSFLAEKPALPEPAALPAAAVASPVAGTKETAPQVEPQLAPAKDVGILDSSSLERPIHRIDINGLYLSESLSLEKLSLTLENSIKTGGAEVRVWTSPVHGLVVTLEGSGWESVGDLSRPPSQIRDGGIPMNVSISSTRFLARVGVGFDFMRLWNITSTELSLSAVAASSSQPILPTVYEIPLQETALLPEIKDEVITMGGGRIRLAYTGKSIGLQGDATTLLDAKRSHSLSSLRLLTEFYPFPSLALQLGALAQQGQWTFCEEEEARCLLEGKVITNSRVIGGLIGAAIVLR